FVCNFPGHVAHGNRLPGIVGVAAGGDPPHHGAAMPDGLVAYDVRILGVHDEGAQAHLSPACPFGRRACLADEVRALVVGDETVEPRLERPIDGAVLTPPGTVVLFESKRIESAGAEKPDAEFRTRFHQ